ncbi:hypothetical protein SAMN06296386_105221 [Lachnospiraceae bacterium]|nr:hypothetical protein SAMN06296386_105221 [Lachnospiraceae bacterium]
MAAFFVLFALIYGIMALMAIGMIVINCIGAWKMFVKAGEEGWKCLIPFYNIVVWGKILKREDIAKTRLIVTVIGVAIISVSLGILALMTLSGVDENSVILFIGWYIPYITGLLALILGKVFLYLMRCYIFEAYNVPKLFILMFMFLPGIAYFVIGIKKEYSYQYAVQTFDQPSEMN